MSATVSAQDQVAYYQTNVWNIGGCYGCGHLDGTYGANSIGGAWAPDLIGQVKVDQAWGLFQFSVAAHNNHAGY